MQHGRTFRLWAVFICWLALPGILSARLQPPEGTEDVRRLGENASFVFHARVLSIEPVAGQDTIAGQTVHEVQIAHLDVDRWYKGTPALVTVRLKYVYPGFVPGQDCIDLHRSSSWLVFANASADGFYELSDSCQGALPMSTILAPGKKRDWSQQSQQDLIAGLQDGDAAVRLANIARLGGLKLRSSTGALQNLIDYGSEAESKWATYAVLRSGDLSVLPKAESIVIAIDRSLGERDPHLAPQPDAAPFFTEPEVQIAIWLQREVRDREAVPALIRILESAKAGWVRECAMSALQDIKDPRSLPVVVDHLIDSHAGVQYHALGTIKAITDAAECSLPPAANVNVSDSAIQAAAEACRTWWLQTGRTREWTNPGSP